ncbi:MAG: Flp family type IVb pilin [Dehalococcoidia bacterium]
MYGFVHNEKGQDMAEYGLILALVAVVVIGALTSL